MLLYKHGGTRAVKREFCQRTVCMGVYAAFWLRRSLYSHSAQSVSYCGTSCVLDIVLRLALYFPLL